MKFDLCVLLVAIGVGILLNILGQYIDLGSSIGAYSAYFIIGLHLWMRFERYKELKNKKGI